MGAKLKVGDRVRALNTVEGEFTSGKIYVVRRVNTYGVTVERDDSGRTDNGWGFSNFELINPSLRIKAGRYYKTRDGRKVGPMKSNGRSGFIEKFGDGRVWEDDGTHRKVCEDVMKASDDLVAIWEEPAVAAAASNDNGATAKPKFKVGDRVHASYGGISGNGKVVRVDADDENMPYLVDIDGHGTLWCYSSSVTAPKASNPAIVALIENDQPKPATRPKIHDDQASATKEAERLALAHPGQRFGVFILADSKIAERYEETVWGTRLVA